ncbi:PREDICTED: perilipin-3-like isoform X2 [Crocodylus porosus]|uniref:perilipin-3-like isoform X2 n=1 Tax=Crocodylus porosus TaxID=8502 RepID=UPI000939A48C|nr:PREDICTED: perilipin-3-like isoform X2 [Crocodylus porosus]XP_019412535.1 PREDICTED: perilipin-3-like isoform X2 [Crocodylus porosus]
MTSPEPSKASPKEPGVELELEQQQNLASRVASLPLVSSAYDMVSAAYASTKDTHPYVRSVCDVAEKGVKTLGAVAASGAQPLLAKLEPQISTANDYACKGLDKLEETLPILQQPTDKILSDTKDLVTSTVTGAKDALSSSVSAVSSRVTGAVDFSKGAVQGGVELTRAAVASGVSTVMGSAMGQMVASGVGAVLGKSEELVDHYLPMTNEELAKLATAVEGFDVASVEQQKQQQSYFVRLGSLSSKLRHRAYQHSLGKLRRVRQSTQEGLAQLHHAIELMEHVKQGVDQKVQGGREKLQQMWLEWRQTQSGAGQGREADSKGVMPEQLEQVESLALAMSRGLTQQLQAASQTLASSLQGLPASIQDKVVQATKMLLKLMLGSNAVQCPGAPSTRLPDLCPLPGTSTSRRAGSGQWG